MYHIGHTCHGVQLSRRMRVNLLYTTFGGKSSTVESGGEHTLRGGLAVVGYCLRVAAVVSRNLE